MTGRDVNCVYRTWRHVYPPSRCVVACGCPRAAADAVVNELPPLEYRPKHELCHVVDGLGARNAAKHSWDVLVTAGRHGLHESTALALNRQARDHQLVRNVVYVSCNVVSMAKDVATLREAFVVRDFESYDFFPGSDYTMTMLHLVPRRWRLSPHAEGVPRPLQRSHRVLVLPVGLPGSGKSSVGTYLAQVFGGASSSGSLRGSETPSKTASTKQRTPPATAVSRAMPQHATTLTCRHIERDSIFAALRDASCGLNKARALTHERMMTALGDADACNSGSCSDVLYLDSTNGSAEARALYATAFAAAAGAAGDDTVVSDQPCAASMDGPSVLVLVFQGGTDAAEVGALVTRALARTGHPAFPTTEEAATEKITNVALGMQWPTDADRYPCCTRTVHLRPLMADSTQASVRLAALTHVVAAVICESSVAATIANCLGV
jgi:hypothetical protein